MEMNAALAVLLGLFVRLALPLLLTVLLVYGLRRLDMRWQKEAEEERDRLIRGEEPCWMEQGLPLEEIKTRAVMDGKPCWQIRRLPNGHLRDACLTCGVFLDAPAPALEHSKAHA